MNLPAGRDDRKTSEFFVMSYVRGLLRDRQVVPASGQGGGGARDWCFPAVGSGKGDRGCGPDTGGRLAATGGRLAATARLPSRRDGAAGGREAEELLGRLAPASEAGT